MSEIYKGHKIELKVNILGLWVLYIDDTNQEEFFVYDLDGIKCGRQLVDTGMSKVGAI